MLKPHTRYQELLQKIPLKHQFRIELKPWGGKVPGSEGVYKFEGVAYHHVRELHVEITAKEPDVILVRLIGAKFVTNSLDNLGEIRNEKGMWREFGFFPWDAALGAAAFEVIPYNVNLDRANCKTYMVAGKSFNGELSDASPVENSWIITPKIDGEITNYARYLIMSSENSHGQLFLNWRRTEKMSEMEHKDLLVEGYAPVGGGFINLENGKLSIHGLSLRFDYPPFEIVVDAAKAIIRAVSDFNRIKTVILEGIEQFEISNKYPDF